LVLYGLRYKSQKVAGWGYRPPSNATSEVQAYQPLADHINIARSSWDKDKAREQFCGMGSIVVTNNGYALHTLYLSPG